MWSDGTFAELVLHDVIGLIWSPGVVGVDSTVSMDADREDAVVFDAVLFLVRTGCDSCDGLALFSVKVVLDSLYSTGDCTIVTLAGRFATGSFGKDLDMGDSCRWVSSGCLSTFDDARRAGGGLGPAPSTILRRRFCILRSEECW